MTLTRILAALAFLLAGLAGPAPAVAAEVSGVSSTPVVILVPRSEVALLTKCIAGLDGVATTNEKMQAKTDGSSNAGFSDFAAADYVAGNNTGAGLRMTATVSGVAITPGTVDALALCRLGQEAKAAGYTGGDIPPKP